MTTNEANRRNGTDPRPRHALIGVDATGAHHVWTPRRDRVLVVDPDDGARELAKVVPGHRLDEWMDDVADARGWDRTLYGAQSLAERLADALATEASA